MLVAVNTNVLMEFRFIKELPWRELFSDADHIRLVVPHTVIKEVDKHKIDPNPRRSRRARKLMPLFDQCLEATDGRIVVYM